tara:strand:- start:1065 stop:1253 length:189 start_codon:yes stop_codon:yes gene_type:complete
MFNWQFIFLNFAISGFIIQIILIIGVLIVSKALPKEKTDKELLEKIYTQSNLSTHYIKNLKS